MTGIKMSDCRFYVNEKERTIVCVIPNVRNMLLDYIWEHFTWNTFNVYELIRYTAQKQYSLPNTFIGKAVCAAEDEWNEETGKLIAFSRAKDKCYKSFFKRANCLVQSIDYHLNDMIDSFNSFGQQLDDRRTKLQKKIDEKVTK